MMFLNVAGQMLEMKSDPQVEDIAARCVEAVMNAHFNPEFGLLNEIIRHDLSRDPDYAQYSYTGHACETLWMVMQEGLRKKDDGLFNLAAERFRRHVEVCHDDVYGGWFRSLDHVDENRWTVDKYSWLQEEVLVGTMILVEQTGSAWAQEWYGRAWNYVLEKLALRQHGFPLWANNGDRRWTFVRHARDCEHFHHPRHLMQNIQALDRLMKRDGSPGRLSKGPGQGGVWSDG
jgi:mannose/cellobiose epimerase-like protein (N-acyl-D-glucosamine 2-epimerase family)